MPTPELRNFVASMRSDIAAAVGIIHCVGMAAKGLEDGREIELALEAARYRLEIATSNVLDFGDKAGE